ncbi:1-acyl-sn-glycerol-3-phosphate acyltransferase [Streptomyces lasalocidi]
MTNASTSRRHATRLVGALVTGLRRTATATLLFALIPTVATLVVAAGVLCAPVSLATRGPWKPVRITSFALFYLLVDLAGLMAAAILWARQLPDKQNREERRAADAFAVLERLLRLLRRAAERVFRLQVEVRPPPPGQTGHAVVPVLVFVRHAGVGDSFLLLQILLSQAGLRPHTVLKRTLRADPALDVLIGRVPHCFLPPLDGRAEDAIGDLAAQLTPGDALVIFPEGGNFTPRRRQRAIASLRRRGLPRRASRAEQMRHVLPPLDSRRTRRDRRRARGRRGLRRPHRPRRRPLGAHRLEPAAAPPRRASTLVAHTREPRPTGRRCPQRVAAHPVGPRRPLDRRPRHPRRGTRVTHGGSQALVAR